MIGLPHIDQARGAPELAPLAVLGAALDAARVALLAESPEIDDVGESFEGRAPPLYLALASLIVTRADELANLLGWYRLAIDDLQHRRDRERDDHPF